VLAVADCSPNKDWEKNHYYQHEYRWSYPSHISIKLEFKIVEVDQGVDTELHEWLDCGLEEEAVQVVSQEPPLTLLNSLSLAGEEGKKLGNES